MLVSDARHLGREVMMGLFSKTAREMTSAIAWDEKTRAHFAESGRFNVSITSVTKRFGFGTTDLSYMREPMGYEVSGIITYPKYVQVELQIQQEDSREFGGWFYNKRIRADELPPKPDIPCLDMWVYDPQHKIAEALYESHKAAIACGSRKSEARFWKRPGDGVMTAKDIEAGWSTESRYPLLGVYIWSLYESRSLPKWALPYGTKGFSTENLPSAYDMEL
jgi:hypothetical protein